MNIPPLRPNAPKHLDLHTGIGGFSLGARYSGYKTIGHSEIEPYCNELLSKRFPNVPNLGDVRTLCKRNHDCIAPPYLTHEEAVEQWNNGEEVELWCAVHDEPFGDCACIGTEQFLEDHGAPDIITSGAPCQSFSVNGKRGGMDDPRGALAKEGPRIAHELGVPIFVLENVAGIKTRGFDELATLLEELGYSVGTVVVNAHCFGAAHQRERVFAVGYLTSERVERLRAEGVEESRPLAPPLLSLRTGDGEWKIEPDIRRGVHGVSGGMDRSGSRTKRIKALGNSLMPQIAAAILDLIPELIIRNSRCI